MTAPRVNTITLSVAQGESPHPTATFGPAMAARQVAVGSGPEAQWKVRAVGVEPVHCELYWDGNILWVRDAGSLSGVYVGTERADEWQQVFDATEVLFGGAVLRAVVVGPDARSPAAAAPAAGASAAFLDEEESTVVFSNQPLMEAMRASGPPAPMAGSGHGGHGGPHGRLATMAPVRGIPQVPSLPGLPGMTPAPMAPAPMVSAPVVSAPSLPPKAPVSEATVIRQSPYAAMEAAGMLPSSGPVGSGPMSRGGERTDERTVMANPGEILAQAGIAMPMVQPPRSATMAPPLAPGLQPMMPGAMPPPAFGGTNPLAPAVPPPQGVGPMGVEGDDPFGPMELPPPPQSPGKGLTTLPPRTLALAGVVLALCALLLMLGPAQGPAASAGASGGQGGGPPRPSYVVRTIPAPAPTSNNILQLPIGAPGLVGVIVPAPMAAVDAAGRPRALPPPNPNDPIRQAAEAVAANRYADAAERYERLAVQYPEAPLFRQFATVLRARAAQQRCTPGVRGCTPSPTPTLPSTTPAPGPGP